MTEFHLLKEGHQVDLVPMEWVRWNALCSLRGLECLRYPEIHSTHSFNKESHARKDSQVKIDYALPKNIHYWNSFSLALQGNCHPNSSGIFRSALVTLNSQYMTELGLVPIVAALRMFALHDLINYKSKGRDSRWYSKFVYGPKSEMTVQPMRSSCDHLGISAVISILSLSCDELSLSVLSFWPWYGIGEVLGRPESIPLIQRVSQKSNTHRHTLLRRNVSQLLGMQIRE
jgi:hypothetical protein